MPVSIRALLSCLPEIAMKTIALLSGTLAIGLAMAAGPALAEDAIAIEPELPGEDLARAATIGEAAAEPQGATGPQEQPARVPDQAGGAPPFALPRPVFDETWLSVGLGAGLVPSYAGSDDYVFFPLPLIVGRVGGVGISPNGPGFVLDVNSAKPSFAPPKSRLSFGPAFRIRNDRVAQIEDPVVELLPDLDLAIELGGNIGYSFPSVFKSRDALTISTQVRFDVAGAHEGMLIEPSIGYRLPVNQGVVLQVSTGLQFVDDSFAEYYFSVTPGQSALSGLPVFNADGGLNSVGTIAILNVDLNGNQLDGGFNIYAIGGYTRIVGDGADTPFTSIRGDANQFIAGVGLGYTF
jgi:outer membrane scaffolding protein for murein synthesis (MipA/OmpV family)